MGAWALAIDFGSVSTVAAAFAESVEIVRFDGRMWMPSAVALTEQSSGLMVGWEAARVAVAAPWLAERMPQARMRADTIRLGENSVATIDAVAAVLRCAFDTARAGHDREPPSAVRLTHPATWGTTLAGRLLDAAQVAGIPAPELVPVPVAAALGFDRVVEPGRLVVVYYLGALTFQTCLLRSSGSSFEVVGRPRSLSLGGEDVDQLLCRHLIAQLGEADRHALGSPGEPGQLAQEAFRRDVQAAKEALAEAQRATVIVPEPVSRELVLSRAELERLSRAEIETTTLAELDALLSDAAVDRGELTAVFLAGGSTQLPGLARMVGERLGVEVICHEFPAGVTALGAARLSGQPSVAVTATGVHRAELPEEEIAAVDIEVDEDVQFTVFRPQTVQPNRWCTLLAFAHKSDPFVDESGTPVDPFVEVTGQASARLGEAFGEYGHLSQDSAQSLPRASGLTFVPEADGVEFNPPTRAFRWLEPVHQEEFRMRAEPRLDGKRARGSLSVYLGSILIAEVSLSFNVSSDYVPPALGQEAARPYRKIFVSYSHRDVAIVEQVEKFLSVYGDEFLRDARDLRAGEVWEERLTDMIRDADVFQLFWSKNSMSSPFVRKEWTFALSLRRPYFVRPTYWEQPMPELPEEGLPPEELRRLHFRLLPIELAEAVAELSPTAAGAPAVLLGSAASAEAASPSISDSPAAALARSRSLSVLPGGAETERASTSVESLADGPPRRRRRAVNSGLAGLVAAVALAVPIALGALSSGGAPPAGGPTTRPSASSAPAGGSSGTTASSGSSAGSGAGSTDGASSSPAASAPPTTTAASSTSTAISSTSTVPSGAVAACGGSLFIGPNASCSLASAVRSAYARQGGGVIALTNPDGTSYHTNCSGSAPTTCTGDGGTTVFFYP